jgi:ribosomal protein S24E
LKRKEIDAVIEHPEEATPSMAQVQHLIAKHLNTSAERTEIKTIHTSKGTPYSLCTAFIWDSKTVKDHAKKETKEGSTEGASGSGEENG